jgi:hypothetical protein
MKITFHSTPARLVPRLRADQTSGGSTPRAPLNALVTTGSRQPRKIAALYDLSPMPNHSSSTGISADFGIG